MENAIVASGLCLSYGKKNILSDISFEIKKGEAIALIGENGSGKSTLLAVIAGITKPACGNIFVSGKTSYLPQDISLIEELTFNENLKFFASLAHRKVPAALPFDADALRKIPIKKMSGGMKKLCSIVCTLLCDADIYLFDEPCAALDKEHREAFCKHVAMLKRQGKTILYVAHDKSEYTSFADAEIIVSESGLEKEDLRVKI